MSLRDDLAGVLARDPRYTIQAYAFVFESLEFTKTLRKSARARSSARNRDRGKGVQPRHVTGQELCEGARQLALENYGLMALTVLKLWGLRFTSDFGEVVFNLIASGDLEKTPSDSRTDFDEVYDFDVAFRRDFVFVLDEVA